MLYHAILYHAVLYHAMLCYAMIWSQETKAGGDADPAPAEKAGDTDNVETG